MNELTNKSITHLFLQLESDPSLLAPNQLRRRLEALDLVDTLDAHFPEASHDQLHRRISNLRASLEAVNSSLYQSIRNEIKQGNPHTLLHWVRSSAEDAASPANGPAPDPAPGHDNAYDHLDELISGILSFEEPAVEPAPLGPEMVFYQPTPARHIFRLIALAALTPADTLIDLGSGLGHVPLLAAICTGAHAIGIELEPAYIERARQCAHQLNLSNVTFLQQDARAANLSTGTVFYLYTPFTGSILRNVLDQLKREAATRPIRICTYGPCTTVIAQEPWLKPTAPPLPDRITLFHSRP